MEVICTAVFFLSILQSLALALSAQVLLVGSVDGIVKDPSGALLTGVKLTLKNVDTKSPGPR